MSEAEVSGFGWVARVRWETAAQARTTNTRKTSNTLRLLEGRLLGNPTHCSTWRVTDPNRFAKCDVTCHCLRWTNAGVFGYAPLRQKLQTFVLRSDVVTTRVAQGGHPQSDANTAPPTSHQEVEDKLFTTHLSLFVQLVQLLLSHYCSLLPSYCLQVAEVPPPRPLESL
jgi:hypothetical protein